MLRNEAGLVSSMVEPTRRPNRAAPIPIAVAAFMAEEGSYGSSAYPSRTSSVADSLGRNRNRNRNGNGNWARREAQFQFQFQFKFQFQRLAVPPSPGLIEDSGPPLAHGCRDHVRGLGHDDLVAGGERDHG